MLVKRKDAEQLKLAAEKSLNDYIDHLYYTLPKEPEIDEDYIDINFNPEEKSIFYSRRFRPTDKIGDLKNFAKVKLYTDSDLEFYEPYTKESFLNDDITLKEANFNNKMTLVVKQIN